MIRRLPEVGGFVRDKHRHREQTSRNRSRAEKKRKKQKNESTTLPSNKPRRFPTCPSISLAGIAYMPVVTISTATTTQGRRSGFGSAVGTMMISISSSLTSARTTAYYPCRTQRHRQQPTMPLSAVEPPLYTGGYRHSLSTATMGTT